MEDKRQEKNKTMEEKMEKTDCRKRNKNKRKIREGKGK